MSNRWSYAKMNSKQNYNNPYFNYGDMPSGNFSNSMMNRNNWSMQEQRSNRSQRVRKRGPPVPELGKPGALDDIRRKGLSGAGVRWYLRYLQQGLSPSVARQKAGEHRTKPENPETCSPPQKKRLRPNEEETRGSHIESVTVLPKKYPNEMLSEDESAALEEAIVDEIAKGSENKLQFDSIHYEDGRLIVVCAKRSTANWLLRVASKLSNWSGTEVTAFPEEDFAKRRNVYVFLPHSVGQDHKKSLALLNAQNPKLNIDFWHVIESRDEDDNQVLSLSIDEKSFDFIKKENNVLRYRYGKIRVGEFSDDNTADKEANDAEEPENNDLEGVEEEAQDNQIENPETETIEIDD